MRSASWNYLGYFSELAVGFLLVAYVVRRIPVEDYGRFLLVQSIVGFLFLLDLGLSNIVVPLYVSTNASRGIAEVGRQASTLFVWFFSLGTLGAAGLVLLALAVPGMIKFPAAHMALALRLLILAAVTVPLEMAAAALDYLCQAFHRFDLLNQVKIAALVLRVVLTVAVLASGMGVVALAAVQATVSLVRLLILWLVVRMGIGGLSLRLFCFDRSRIFEAIKVSRWAFGDDLSRRIGMNAETLILAGLGSVRQVAMFSMGGKLPAHFFHFAARGLSVATPSLSQHHSHGDTTELRKIYQNAYRVCLTGFLPLVVFAAICARPLVEVWAGRNYLEAAPVMVCLLLLAMSQMLEYPNELVLYSHDRIRTAARFSVIETAGKIVFALALAVQFGALGVAAGIAVWHWCVNLFFYLPEASRVAGMHPWELWRNAGRGALVQWAAFAVGAFLLIECLRHFSPVGVFAAFAAVSLTYAVVWVCSTGLPMCRPAEEIPPQQCNEEASSVNH